MELKRDGNSCSGRYFYDKYRLDVWVRGEIQDNNNIILKELDGNGKETNNIFKGKYSAEWDIIEGAWENKNKDKPTTL